MDSQQQNQQNISDVAPKIAKAKTLGTPQPATFENLLQAHEGTANQSQPTTSKQYNSHPTSDSESGKIAPQTKLIDFSQQANTVQTNVTKPTEVTTPTEPTNEQLKSFFEKNNIPFDGDVNALLEKLKPKPVEPTEEEKKLHEKKNEERQLDIFLNNGGTVEQYAALKSIASADPKDFSLSETRRELKEAGFKNDEIDNIIKERYYQIDDEEINQYDDETEKEFIQRKKAYGSKKLENRSLHTKKQAEELLASLKKEIETEDLLAQKEQEFSSNVDETLKALPRKLTFQLGEAAGQSIDPIDIEIPDDVIAEVGDMLKTREKRQQFFFKNNGLNIENVATVLAREKVLEKALKIAYGTATTRQVEEFKKVFPDSPHDLGVGGNYKPNGKVGKLASIGKPEVVNKRQ